MSNERNQNGSANQQNDDVDRVSQETSGRLAALGIRLDGSETSEQLVDIVDAVERFESAVEAQGGDLMVDEGMSGPASQPDNPRFALPLRHTGESVGAYVSRVSVAADEVGALRDAM